MAHHLGPFCAQFSPWNYRLGVGVLLKHHMDPPKPVSWVQASCPQSLSLPESTEASLLLSVRPPPAAHIPSPALSHPPRDSQGPPGPCGVEWLRFGVPLGPVEMLARGPSPGEQASRHFPERMTLPESGGTRPHGALELGRGLRDLFPPFLPFRQLGRAGGTEGKWVLVFMNLACLPPPPALLPLSLLPHFARVVRGPAGVQGSWAGVSRGIGNRARIQPPPPCPAPGTWICPCPCDSVPAWPGRA